MIKLFTFAVFVTWVTASLSPTVSPTVSPPRYKFGQSAPLTGILYSRLGISMKAGTKAAFRKINDEGGIHGRQLDLITYDDMGDSTQTANNSQKLIADKVLGAVSYVRGSTSSLSILQQYSIPMIAPYAGWRSLRLPVNRYAFHARASLDEEMNAWVSYCIARGITLFSVYYQDDGYGRTGLDSLQLALTNKGLGILSIASFPADSTVVSIDGLKNASIDPQSIVMIAGTPEPLGKFAALAKKQWPKCLLHANSYGSSYFLESLIANNITAAQAQDIFVTQVFPVPQNLSVLLAANATEAGTLGRSSLLLDFALAMNVSCPGCNLTFDALEGFVAGSLIGKIMEAMDPLDANSRNFRRYLDKAGINASDVSLDHEPSLIAYREYLIDTLYTQSSFEVSGLRLGPYVPNISCPANSINCVQPLDAPCSQGMQNVFLTQPDVVNRQYIELPEWRVASPSCYFFSQATPDDQKPLVFGQSAVFTGQALDLGYDMRNGILAAFAEANRSPARGVRGRQLLLLSMDDYYTAPQAAINARALINNQTLLAVIGAVGTPPTEAVVPLYAAAGVPLVGTLSGARSMRHPWVVNVRALYDDEVAGMVNWAVGKGLKKISVFYQNDSFGFSGIAAAKLALEYHKMEVYSVGGYNRIGPDYPATFRNLTDAGVPDALIMFCTSMPAASFIELTLNHSDWANTVFLAASPSDPDRFQMRLSRAAVQTGRVYSSTVVPPVSSDTFSQNYVNALRLIDSRLFVGKPYNPTLAAMEGYLIGRFMIGALARVTEFTGKALLDEIHVTYGLNIDNYTLGPYTTSCNMGLRTTHLVRINDDNVTQFSLVESFHVTRDNSFKADCGALTIYDDNFECPAGYYKEYTTTDTLASTCKVCLSPYGCHIPEREANMSLRAAMLALNIIGLLVALMFMGIVWKYRNTVTIKAVSPPFCGLILLGAALGYLYIFVQYDPIPTDNVCMAQVYILNTASCLIFASLFAKVFRVTQIFKPKSAEAFRVLKIRDGPLFIGVGTMWALLMIYTAVWHATSPMVVVHNSNPEEQYYICESEDSLWGIVDILANGIFLLYGVMLSIQSRKIPTVFNEAKFVAATMYNTLILGTIAILAGYGLSKNNDQLFLYKSVGAFVIFTVDICLLIGSKMPSLYGELFHGKIPQFKNDSSSDANSDTSKTRESTATTRSPRIELEKRSPTLSDRALPRTPVESNADQPNVVAVPVE